MTRTPAIIALGLCFLIALTLVLVGGAFEGEFGKHGDESAHVLSGMLVLDFVKTGNFSSPIEFARAYYEHYPGFAIGVWPPLFYVLEAGWGSLFGFSKASLLVLQCLSAGLNGAIIVVYLRGLVSPLRSIGFACVFSLLPVVSYELSWIAVDIWICLCTLVSIHLFARYVESPSLRRSILFGVAAGLSLLVKGSAGFLAFLPAYTIVATKRWNLLRRLDLWVSAVVVIATAGPWYFLTTGIASDTFAKHLGIAFWREAIPSYVSGTWTNVGILIAGPLLVVARAGDQSIRSKVAAAATFSAFTFLLLVPADVDPRYLMPAFASSILSFALALPRGDDAVARRVAMAGYIGALVWAFTRIPRDIAELAPIARGYRAVSSAIVALDARSRTRVLISSDEGTEGGLLVHVAQLDSSRPSLELVRATKVLASMTWQGKNYRLRSQSPILKQLDSLGITSIAIANQEQTTVQHQKLLWEATSDTRHWRCVTARSAKYLLFVRANEAELDHAVRVARSFTLKQNTRF
ncbi:MAG: glycosyltransferase family 39 protein [Gemmatimonadaceae bacterium]|nr:glycosyltransferase family 39 protein [Gemmatimonadaceae bacterium]